MNYDKYPETRIAGHEGEAWEGPEAVVAKLMWLLGQTKDHAEISRLFYGSISHDMLYTEELPHEG